MKDHKKIQDQFLSRTIQFDPAQARANAIAKETQERFNKIADKLLDIIKQEKVSVSELPLIISNLTGRVNKKIDGATIEDIIKL